VWLVMLALLTSCAGTGLMAWSQRHVNVGLTSILSLLTAVIASAGGRLFFDQQLTVAQLVGGTGVLVGLAGVLAAQFSRS
jgi:drug/metabolite transporter (DMT)-like permease